MNKQNQDMMELLQANKGFVTPEIWLDYAMKHNFKKIKASHLVLCPDCSGHEFSPIGQYVYYSTLMKLNKCHNCGLIFSDTWLDSEVIKVHFEGTYKDENYFSERRRHIFSQISDLADRVTPKGGSVLDIGGAKGHLLSSLLDKRADLKATLNDLSKDACDYAISKFKLNTICGDVKMLEKYPYSFDTVIMSDVLYYEPFLSDIWKILPNLVAKDGYVIIRVPNKFLLIKLNQFLIRLFLSNEKREMQDNIKYFNPEHIYVLTSRYLLDRLRSIGFHQAEVMPSKLLFRGGSINKVADALYYHVAKVIACLFKSIITPSLLIIARKGKSN